MNNTVSSPEDLKKAILGWLTYRKINHGDYGHDGCIFYFEKEWIERDEACGQGSPLTIISEGDLYRLWNRDPCFDRKPLKELKALAEKHGYYAEMGFTWSIHFYRIDP